MTWPRSHIKSVVGPVRSLQVGTIFYGTLGISLEKAMAPHSSILAWKIPWMEEPGRLQSMGSLRVGHDWVTSLSLFTFTHWRSKWQPTPMFLPGESQERGSLVGCCLWGAQSQTRLKWLSSSSSRDKPSLLHTTPLFVNLFLSQFYNSTDWISPQGNHSKIRNCPSLSGQTTAWTPDIRSDVALTWLWMNSSARELCAFPPALG